MFAFLFNFPMFQGPNVQYQNQKFCREKDLEKGRWLILGNMQKELYAFSAHFDNWFFSMTGMQRIPQNMNSDWTKHFWNEAFHECAMILISAFVKVGMEPLLFYIIS